MANARSVGCERLWFLRGKKTLGELLFAITIVLSLFLTIVGRLQASTTESEAPTRDIKAISLSPKEKLRQEWFGKSSNDRQCKIVSSTPKPDIKDDAQLNELINQVMTSVRTSSDKALRDLFHPRLKIKSTQIIQTLATLQRITGKVTDVSHYRTYGINSPDGSAQEMPCGDDPTRVNPLFGYPLSVGVWLQVTGDTDIARIYFSAVPMEQNSKSPMEWALGSWHVQQWSHGGLDFAMWFEKAKSYAAKANKVAAYITADIAIKLLDGGAYLTFPGVETAKAWQASVMSAADFAKAVAQAFPKETVVSSATLFVPQGAGLLTRFRLNEEISAHAIKARCEDRLRDVLSQPWGDSLQGIRCAYLLPRERPERDGVLGTLYVDRKVLAEAVKKP